MRTSSGRILLLLLLLSGVVASIATPGVGPAAANSDPQSNLCGLRFCPPDPLPPPGEPRPPFIDLTAWSYNAGQGVWEKATAGLPYGGPAGDDYRLLAQLRADDGSVIADADVSIAIQNFPAYQCEEIPGPAAPLPPGGQTEIRLRVALYPCAISVSASIDGKSYYLTRTIVAVQLSPNLTWLSAGGVPIDVPDFQSLGTVSAGDTRTFGLRTDDPLGEVTLTSYTGCTVEPLGTQDAGTRYFRISAVAGVAVCGLVGTTARSSDMSYSRYGSESLYATLTVGPALWFGWMPGWEPPVAFAYPSGPVAVKAGADLTGVNISASGPCTVSLPAIYGWDPWLITPTGVGDCVLTITALVIDLENPGESFPALTYTIPVLPAAPPNTAPVASFGVDQPSTAPPSTVQFDASGSSDGDGDALTYLWDFGNGSGGSGATGSATYDTPGTYTVTLTVMDPYGATDTTTRTVTVSDPTPPVVTPIVQGTVGSDGWHTGDVDLSWSVVDPESPVTSATGCDAVTVVTDTGAAGATYTCSATSAGGTTTTNFTLGRDATPPVLDPTVTPAAIPLGGSATVNANATDVSSGIASATCGTVDTSSLGTRTVTCTATDRAGNTAAASVQYSVVLGWQGFTGPVHAPPVLNGVDAGGGVPVSFSLGGNRGLRILTAGSPSSTRVPCPAGAPVDHMAQTRPVRASNLTYDASTATYTYMWATNVWWRGTCRELRFRLVDGTQYVALFDFRVRHHP